MANYSENLNKYDYKIIFLGFGSVAKSAAEILFDFIPETHVKEICVFEKVKNKLESSGIYKEWTEVKKYKVPNHGELKQTTFADQLIASLNKNLKNILIDLSVNVDSVEIIKEVCLKHDVLYANAAIEVWKPSHVTDEEYVNVNTDPKAYDHFYFNTIYNSHMDILEIIANMDKNKKYPTIVLDFGANPGLIAHFAFSGLMSVANKVLKESSNTKLKEALKPYVESRQYNKIAQLLDCCVLHCAEKDTQITHGESSRKPGEFVNTWSCDGFIEEGMAPVQIGFGTHESLEALKKDERRRVHNYVLPPKETLGHQLFFPVRGARLNMKSYVPGYGKIIGMNIPHSENSSLTLKLSVYNENNECIYRPSAYYVYHPSDSTITSIYERYEREIDDRHDYDTYRVLQGKEISFGYDTLGSLLHFRSNPITGEDKVFCWYYGSKVDINEHAKYARGKFNEINATSIQVSSAMLSAIQWAIENPKEGIVMPECLPTEFIINKCKPYLGKMIDEEVKVGEGFYEPHKSLQFQHFIA